MSILDKVISAVTPPESAETRAKARAKARAASEPGDWLSAILDHHEAIEDAFDAVRRGTGAQARIQALRTLGTLLTGHSMAEEAVVYPALADVGKKLSADTAYMEQVAAKMQMAALETMDPMSQDFLDKLGHLEGAVRHHVFKEESEWFLELKEKGDQAAQSRVTARYTEEYGRYMGDDPDGQGAAASRRPPEERIFTPTA